MLGFTFVVLTINTFAVFSARDSSIKTRAITRLTVNLFAAAPILRKFGAGHLFDHLCFEVIVSLFLVFR